MKNLMIAVLLLFSFFANAQIGIGTTSPNSTLDVRGALSLNYRVFTGTSTSISSTDNTIVFTGTAASTATLPDATTCAGRMYRIKNSSTTSPAPTLTIATTASQTIDGLSSWVVDEAYATVTVVSNGTNWNVSEQSLPKSSGSAWAQGGNDVTSAKSFGTTSNYDLPFITNNTERMRIDGSGNVGIGISGPTALLHLKAGTATASTAPLKFTAGTNLTTPEDGALEYNGANLFITNAGVRQTILTSGTGNYMTDPGGNGVVVRTSLNTTTNRTITGTANRITLTNGDGVSGNPVIDVGSNIVDMTVANTYTGGAKQTFVNSASTAGLNLTESADPSTLASGDLWNSTTTANSLKYRDAASTTRTLVDLSLSQTLTNKTISGASNTITNIPNSALTNSSITVATGTTGTDFGVSGSPVSLGGTVTLNLPTASGTNTGKLSSTDWTTFNNKVSTSRTINTTSPITGGGDLSADRTIAINNAAADGSTKGAASFTANDFDASSGNISIDYTNGQAASGSNKGFLTSADWTTFNNKQASGNYMTDPGGNGVVVRTALNTTTNRTLTGTANRINITNGSGTGGDPTFDVGSNIVDMTVANTYTGGAKQTFVNSASTAGLNLTASADPSTLASGDLWNSTTTANSLKYRDAASTTRTLVDLSLSQTLTNKTISGASNTITNIPNSALTNSSISVATGTSGTDVAVLGSPVSLGGTVTLNIPTASASNRGALSSTDWSTFNNKVSTSRTINTTSPITGGGDLSADRTIAINNAAADGSTKGAASFTAADFDASSGNISIDYTNGQAASGSTKGFLSSTDWTTFNNKVSSQWTTSGSDIYRSSGNVGIGTSTFNGTNPEKLVVDAGTTTSVNAIVAKGTINSYLQLNIQNLSSGTGASSDIVATADNGSETTNYVDMGINGSGNTSNVMGGANDAYLYNIGQNLLIGTGTAAKSLVFMTGGQTQSTNERMRIDGSGNVGIGINGPTALLHLKAGTATASTAPLKFTAGTNLTTPENGALEYNGTNLFITNAGVRQTILTSGTGNYLTDPGGNGVVVRTSLNTTTNRTITGTANKITLTNGDGVSGNPTINVGGDIVDETIANTYTGGAKQTFVNSAATAGLNLTASADPSTLASGDLWNSTTTANSLKYRDAASTTRTLVDLSLTQTLTNKTISGASNTITNIPNSALTNSSITVATGTTGTDVGVSGSPVSLGGTVTLNIPTASGTNTGKLSSTDWTTFNNKVSSQWTTSGSDIYYNTGNVGIGTASPSKHLHIAVAQASSPGLNHALIIENTTAEAELQLNPGGTGSTYNLSADDGALGFRVIEGTTTRLTVAQGGNVGIGTSTFDGTYPEKFVVDAGTTTSVNAIVGKGTINSYLQLNIKNLSSGTAASSDVVATADNGSETTNYVDMGINGSGNTSNVMGGANDAYLYNIGQNLLIGTGTAAKSLVFMTGGQTQSTHERMRIDGSGNVGIATNSPKSVLDVDASVGFAIRTTSGSTTLDATDYTLIITSGTPTITLPAASSSNTRRIYVIVNHTGATRTISSYIDVSGASNTGIPADASITVQSNGTSWYQIH